MGVIDAYRSLSDEQKRILKEKTVSMNRPVGEAIALLRPIAECDALVAKSGRFGCIGGLLIPVTILALILSGNGVLPPAVGVMPVALLVIAIIACFALWGW